MTTKFFHSSGIAIIVLIMAGVAFTPVTGGTVLVATFHADAGRSAADVVTRAAGQLVSVRSERVVLARSDDAGFATRLYAEGAAAVLGAPGMDCEPKETTR